VFLGFGAVPSLPAMSAVLVFSASGDRVSAACRIGVVISSSRKFRKVEKEIG
jgi:hypothetical protein